VSTRVHLSGVAVFVMLATVLSVGSVWAAGGENPPQASCDGGPIMAQNPGDAPPAMGGPGMPGRPEMERQRRHLEQLRMLKLLEVLDLGDAQEQKFLDAFRKMRQAMKAADENKREVVDTLSQLLQAATHDDRQINRLVDSVVVLEGQKRETMTSFVTQARAILTAEQMGKLLVFQENFDYQLLERVREFRGQAGKGRHRQNQPDSM